MRHVPTQSTGTLALQDLTHHLVNLFLLPPQLKIENKYLTQLSVCHQRERLQRRLHAVLHRLNESTEGHRITSSRCKVTALERHASPSLDLIYFSLYKSASATISLVHKSVCPFALQSQRTFIKQDINGTCKTGGQSSPNQILISIH